MKRQITDYLLQWKDSKNRKPLIVRGARQVGKTFTIEAFGKDNFDHYVRVNFEETPELKTIFQTNNVGEIIESIELFTGAKISEGNSLLFLDEIQACPKAITVLRYFYEKMPQLHIISAGSLLDHQLSRLKFTMPVGRVEFAYMYPMNFYEFLSAIDEEQLVKYLENFSLEKNIPLLIHNKLLGLIRIYYFIGGMPESVKVYRQAQNLSEVEKVHESILKSLEFDFGKYGTRLEQNLLIKVLRYIPKGIGKKLKYVNIDPVSRSEYVKEALQLLEKSRIVHLIKSTNAILPPLEYGVNEKTSKALFLDIGLANHLLKFRLLDIEQLITTNEGSLAEQFTGQQLLSFSPFYVDKQLYYWNREKRNSEAEIDYLIEVNGKIVPIEVKAGKTGTLKSLHVFMAEKEKQVALRVNTGLPSTVQVGTTVKVNNKLRKVNYRLLSLPLYLINEKVVANLLGS